MTPAHDALLWGVVGALTFLVLAQGYRLLTDRGPSMLTLLAIALGVLAVTTAAARVLATRMRRV